MEPSKKLSPEDKSQLLQAISMLDMLVMAFTSAPERVKKAAKEFKDSLVEWSNA